MKNSDAVLLLLSCFIVSFWPCDRGLCPCTPIRALPTELRCRLVFKSMHLMHSSNNGYFPVKLFSGKLWLKVLKSGLKFSTANLSYHNLHMPSGNVKEMQQSFCSNAAHISAFQKLCPLLSSPAFSVNSSSVITTSIYCFQLLVIKKIKSICSETVNFATTTFLNVHLQTGVYLLVFKLDFTI